jgi:putative Mg2+ transporter-C (MgtC) family protein
MDTLGAAFSSTQFLTDLAQALIAFALGATIGWERHKAHRTAGLRTFPIVAMASCAYVLVGQSAFPGDAQAQARIIQGLITGIGFVGGGAILKDSSRHGVFGIATAASIWNTGAIGSAVGFGRLDVAVILTLLNFLILRLMPTTQADPEAVEMDD